MLMKQGKLILFRNANSKTTHSLLIPIDRSKKKMKIENNQFLLENYFYSKRENVTRESKGNVEAILQKIRNGPS